MKRRRRYVEPDDCRVVAGPNRGGVEQALVDLTTSIANSNCKGVALAIMGHDGKLSFAVHGEIPDSKLALLATTYMKWATED